MHYTRRRFFTTAGAVAALFGLRTLCSASQQRPPKRHIITLSFDDGFKKSSIKTAEIYEKYKLSACVNIVASAHMKDFRPPDYPDVPRGDFGLWKDLKAILVPSVFSISTPTTLPGIPTRAAPSPARRSPGRRSASIRLARPSRETASPAWGDVRFPWSQ